MAEAEAALIEAAHARLEALQTELAALQSADELATEQQVRKTPALISFPPSTSFLSFVALPFSLGIIPPFLFLLLFLLPSYLSSYLVLYALCALTYRSPFRSPFLPSFLPCRAWGQLFVSECLLFSLPSSLPPFFPCRT